MKGKSLTMLAVGDVMLEVPQGEFFLSLVTPVLPFWVGFLDCTQQSLMALPMPTWLAAPVTSAILPLNP